MRSRLLSSLAAILLPAALVALAPRAAAQTYRLASLDEVSISVYDEADLSSTQRIDGQGKVNIPLIGSIKISGRTVREAETIIEEAFVTGRILRNPQVTITIQAYVDKNVTVTGSVKQPGPISFPKEKTSMSIVDAINKAGDFTSVANKKVIVTRGKGSKSEKSWEVDVYAIIKGGSRVQDFLVYPGDIIFVKDRIF